MEVFLFLFSVLACILLSSLLRSPKTPALGHLPPAVKRLGCVFGLTVLTLAAGLVFLLAVCS